MRFDLGIEDYSHFQICQQETSSTTSSKCFRDAQRTSNGSPINLDIRESRRNDASLIAIERDQQSKIDDLDLEGPTELTEATHVGKALIEPNCSEASHQLPKDVIIELSVKDQDPNIRYSEALLSGIDGDQQTEGRSLDPVRLTDERIPPSSSQRRSKSLSRLKASTQPLLLTSTPQSTRSRSSVHSRLNLTPISSGPHTNPKDSVRSSRRLLFTPILRGNSIASDNEGNKMNWTVQDFFTQESEKENSPHTRNQQVLTPKSSNHTRRLPGSLRLQKNTFNHRETGMLVRKKISKYLTFY